MLCELGYAPNDILAIEKNGRRRQLLYDKGYVSEEADFLAWSVEQFPTILMNPPFEQGQDIAHVTHAFTHCLQPGGQLVAVVSEGPFFRQEQKAVAFRELVDTYGYSVQLPANSFKTSGTAVNTRLIYLRKPAEKAKRPFPQEEHPMQTVSLTSPARTAALQLLKPHPAQMRSRYDLDELATLTLQVYQRGLDAWHPILVSQNPGLSKAEGGEGYHIVSGHRRYMAYVLAQAYLAAHTIQAGQSQDGEETAVSLESIRQFIGQLVEKHGMLETAVSELLTFLGQETIPVLLFEGSPKAEILSLQAANYGGEKPDMLGIAHSFRQALPDWDMPAAFNLALLIAPLRQMALPEPLSILPTVVEIVYEQSGNIWLDLSEVFYYSGYHEPLVWEDKTTLEWLHSSWQEAQTILQTIGQLTCWVEQNPQEHLKEIMNLLLRTYIQEVWHGSQPTTTSGQD